MRETRTSGSRRARGVMVIGLRASHSILLSLLYFNGLGPDMTEGNEGHEDQEQLLTFCFHVGF